MCRKPIVSVGGGESNNVYGIEPNLPNHRTVPVNICTNVMKNKFQKHYNSIARNKNNTLRTVTIILLQSIINH